MIRLNLMQNRFGTSSASKHSGDTGFMSDFTTTSMEVISSGKGKKFALAAGVILVLGAIGGGAWYMLQQPGDESLVPESAALPKPTVAETPKASEPAPVDTAKPAAKPAEEKIAEKPPEPKKPEPKPVPKPEPKPKPKPEPVKEAKPVEPPPQSISIQPAVVAPALAGGVVDLVLGESKTKAGAVPAPTRFEDLPALSRLSYQRFAFERILAVVRQVAPPDLRFNSIRLLSPGIVTIQGSAKDDAILTSFVQGLVAQSLMDTSVVRKPNGQFALVARLPFNASFGGNDGVADEFAKTLSQARDLASTQGLELSKTAAPRVQNIAGMKRAQWKLSGVGGWESVSKWISALQSMQCPIGFTSLKLSSGPDGKLRMDADAISYGK